MAARSTTVAYVGMVASAIILLIAGHRSGEAQPAAATPNLTKIATPAVAAAATSVSAAGFTLTSIAVELPAGDRDFPAGPGMEAAQANCVACHSVGMVLNQPALTRTAWEGEVNKMRAVYKAPVVPEDVPKIVDYLISLGAAKSGQ